MCGWDTKTNNNQNSVIGISRGIIALYVLVYNRRDL